ncbi:4Fe-4S binding protein [Clostridium oceanicum]|uniref:4Fe-4S binding protein n=1 Tax=Clostridium oceanicum TaxID=1543 RepID=A0ABP3UI72_9CLOT
MGNFKRRIVQFATALVTNINLKGFTKGTIYRGNSKKICVPGLNCYSCPGAIGSCPIGSLQSVLGAARFHISYYILGFLIFIGVLFGRLVCGWMCPFGLIEDLLYKIPSPKFKIHKRLRFLKYLKYVILLVFVIIIPMFFTNSFNMGEPAFCKYICPSGTVLGGIPLTLIDKSLRPALGFLFQWKVSVLVFISVLSIIVYRPFCRFICPLGAIYSLFNPISIFSFKVDKNKCTSCRACSNKCKLDIEIYKKPNSLECIRCGECIKSCPTKAIKPSFSIKNSSKSSSENLKQKLM